MSTDLIALAKASQTCRNAWQSVHVHGFRKCIVTRRSARQWVVACGWKSESMLSSLNIATYSTKSFALLKVGSWLEG